MKRVSRLQEMYPIDLIAAMPSSGSGGNGLPNWLARSVADMLNMSDAAGTALTRARPRDQQKDIRGPANSQRNVHGSLAAEPSLVRGRSILLIDDILDTGASMGEAFRMLENADATRVIGLCCTTTSTQPNEVLGV